MSKSAMRPSTPGHFNCLELIGTAERTHLARRGQIAFLIRVDDGGGEACRLVVWLPVGGGPEVQPGDRIWAKGTLRVDDVPGRRSLHYLQAQHVDILPPMKGVPCVTNLA